MINFMNTNQIRFQELAAIQAVGFIMQRQGSTPSLMANEADTEATALAIEAWQIADALEAERKKRIETRSSYWTNVPGPLKEIDHPIGFREMEREEGAK